MVGFIGYGKQKDLIHHMNKREKWERLKRDCPELAELMKELNRKKVVANGIEFKPEPEIVGYSNWGRIPIAREI